MSALGYDDNCPSLASLTVFSHDTTHLVFPPHSRRLLRDEDEVSAGGNGGHQSEPTTVSAHDFNNEPSLVGGGSVEDVIHGTADPLKRRIAANGGIRP